MYIFLLRECNEYILRFPTIRNLGEMSVSERKVDNVRGSTSPRFTSLPHVTQGHESVPRKIAECHLDPNPGALCFQNRCMLEAHTLREHAVNGQMSDRSSAFEKYYVHSDCSLLDFPVTPCRVDSKLCPTFRRNMLTHLESD
jgi:hypothetical protein